MKELQSLVGSLKFCARTIPGAVAIKRRFYDAFVGISNPRLHLHVSCAMKEDMRMCLIFLECFIGSVYFPEKQRSDSDSYNVLLIVLAVHSWGVLQYLAVVGLFSIGLTLQF